MALVSNINPSVKFIHHSEENFLEPEAKKQEQRKAAAEAFKKTFGRECDWFNAKEKAKEKVGPKSFFSSIFLDFWGVATIYTQQLGLPWGLQNY